MKKTRGRILAGLLLCAAMLLVCAWAGAESYHLWIGETGVTDSKTSGEGWSYDAEKHTLTLENFSCDEQGHCYDSLHYAAIYYSGSEALNIHLTGTNSILTNQNEYGFLSDKSAAVTISGDKNGSLTINNQKKMGIYTAGNIIFDSGKVTVNGSRDGIKSAGSFTVKNGIVSATTVDLQSGTHYAIEADCFDIRGGEVTAICGQASGSYSSIGIYTHTFMKISGGKVTAVSRSSGQSSYGIQTNSADSANGYLSVGKNASLRAVGNTDALRSLYVTNEITGTGWTDTAATKGQADIDISASARVLNYSAVCFPASDSYPLWVGGTQVNSMNAETGITGGSGKATYDPENHILTLDNYTNSGNGYSDSAVYYKGSDALTVVLTGDNKLTGKDIGICINNIAADLTIRGDGSLETTGRIYGITVIKNLIFDHTKVTAKTTDNDSTPVSAVYADNDIEIHGGSVTAQGGNGKVSYGISTNVGDIIITDGTVIAEAGSASSQYATSQGSSAGIVCGGGLTISGGIVKATGREANGGTTTSSYGVFSFREIDISGGELIAAAGESTGESIGIYVAKNALTITNGKVTAAGYTKAVKNTVKNTYSGTGWSDFAGKQGETAIAANPSGQDLSAYKKVQFRVPVAAPEFSPAGGSYVGAQSVTLSCATDGAEIFYTMDGKEPTAKSGTKYTGAIALADETKNTTIKAVAVKEGMPDSDIVSAEYKIAKTDYTLTVSVPDFDDAEYGYAQPDAKAVTITSTGNTDATVSSVALSGKNADCFSLNKTDGTTVTAGAEDNTTYTVQPAAGLPAGAWTATVTVTYNGGKTAEAAVSFTVTKKTVTVTAKDQTINEGESIAAGLDMAALTGAVEGHALSAVTLTGDPEKGSITPSEAVIKDAAGNDVSANYDIGYTSGTLTVRKAITRKVTFKVVNGSWDDGKTEDISVTLNGFEGDVLKLAADQIPAAGSKPAEGYKEGSWDKVPGAEKEITADTVYTYTYLEKGKISQKVTFIVANGYWDDGSTEDKVVTLTGLEGDTLMLKAEDIPAVGSKPADTYKAGTWDTEPKADTVITEDTTYTYTYAKKDKISAAVTFRVANGSWDDGSTEDKVVTLEGLEGDTLKLKAEDIPAVGGKPAEGYEAGAWDSVPAADQEITADTVYTYTYAEKAPQPQPEPEPEPIPKGEILLPVISKVQKTAMTVSWNTVKAAEGYEVFYGPCGEDSHNAKVVRVSAEKTSCRLKNLKKKGVKSYKVWVRAYVVREGQRIPISTSLKVDSFMKGASAVFTNPKSVSLGTKQIPLAVGKKAKITASVKKEESGKRLTPHLPELRYVSSNTGVASVAEDGTVKGVGNGKCKVYVIAPNGIYKAVQVTVGVKAEELSFTEKQVKVKAGEELDLRALLKAEPKGAYLELKWESKDTKIAKVGKDGVVKGRKKGKTKITVEDKASGLKATILVIVTD